MDVPHFVFISFFLIIVITLSAWSNTGGIDIDSGKRRFDIIRGVFYKLILFWRWRGVIGRCRAMEKIIRRQRSRRLDKKKDGDEETKKNI